MKVGIPCLVALLCACSGSDPTPVEPAGPTAPIREPEAPAADPVRSPPPDRPDPEPEVTPVPPGPPPSHAVTAGHLTRDGAQCTGVLLDCDRDPGNAACDPAGGVVADFSCASADDPLAACRCAFGPGIDWAWPGSGASETGCPIIECSFEDVPCDEDAPALALCEGTAPAPPAVEPGWDWSVPPWAKPAENSGFVSFETDEWARIGIRTIDLTWRQLEPTPGHFSRDTAGTAQGMLLGSYGDQVALDDSPFWVRIFTTAVDWAPEWLPEVCGVGPIGVDWDGQDHLPIWNDCVWEHLIRMYRRVFLEWGLAAHPSFQYAYVPGGFGWAEFDLDLLWGVVASGELTRDAFHAWFGRAMADLAAMMGPDAGRLVFTGEDFAYGPDALEADHLALHAVRAGLGIRTGLTESFNVHLNHIPAYGSRIADNGRILTDDDWPLLAGDRVVGAELECYDACGGDESPPPGAVDHAVRMSSLKALQMRISHLFVVPEESHMAAHSALWRWVRMELGHRPQTAPDAWAALREAKDLYFAWEDGHDWLTRPWVKNMERWLVQRDVCPDGVSRRGSVAREGGLWEPDDVSYEGRQTHVERGQSHLYFDVDADFAAGLSFPFRFKVTYLDRGDTTWSVEYGSSGCVAGAGTVTNQGSLEVRTATFAIPSPVFIGALPGDTDLRIRVASGADLEVYFARLIRESPTPQ